MPVRPTDYIDPYDKPRRAKTVNDSPVEWPAHYNQGDIQCIDAMVEAFGREAVESWARLTAFKYLWRHQYKGNVEQDIDKATWYLRWSRGDDPRKDAK